MSLTSSEDGMGRGDVATSSTENENIHSDTADISSSQDENKQRRSILRRVMGIFSFLGYLFHRSSNEDFEKKLQHLSKEEAATRIRLKRRSETWRKLARALVIYSIVIELFLLGIAIIMTRASELSWQLRALRVLPMFAFPTIVSLVYSACASFYRMRERKDQKSLDRLSNERKAKIDELKERTNYYLTQQLIHKYDSDPAAKEAAARVLASKLGADAGLAFSLEPSNLVDGSKQTSSGPIRHNSEQLGTTGLRRRSGHQVTPSVRLSHSGQLINETAETGGIDSNGLAMEVDHIQGKITPTGGGWVARLAAMLVGEDPTQCYALICKNCHMHNGLARKEDFEYIAYHCPHCHVLNGSRQLGDADGNSLTETTPRVDALEGVRTNAKLMIADRLVTQIATAEHIGVEPESSANYITASDSGGEVIS